MTIYTFYRMTHPNHPEFNFVGSTMNLKTRKSQYKTEIKNDLHKRKINEFIRSNNINFNEIIFEVLLECDTDIHLQIEQSFIDKFKSINEGLNNNMSFNPDTKKIWYENNKDYWIKYRLDNKEKLQEKYKKYYQENTDYFRNYYNENKENIKELHKNYYKNKVVCSECNNEFHRNYLKRHMKFIHKI